MLLLCTAITPCWMKHISKWAQLEAWDQCHKKWHWSLHINPIDMRIDLKKEYVAQVIGCTISMRLTATDMKSEGFITYPTTFSQDQPNSCCKTVNSHSSSETFCFPLIWQFLSCSFVFCKHTNLIGLCPYLLLLLSGGHSSCRAALHCRRVSGLVGRQSKQAAWQISGAACLLCHPACLL